MHALFFHDYFASPVFLYLIPEGVPAGKYQAGVYCQNPHKGPTAASGWLDFEIIKK